MTAELSTAMEILASMWFEISFTVFFGLGYLLMRFEKYYSKNYAPKLSRKGSFSGEHKLQKAIEAHVSSGQGTLALKAWRSAKIRQPTQVESLKVIVKVLLDEEPSILVQEITEHIACHPQALQNSKTFTAVLDVVAKKGNIVIMEELAQSFETNLRVFPTGPTYEVLLVGYAHVGDVGKLKDVQLEMHSAGYKLTIRGHSLMIKGFLKNSMVDAAFEQIQEMQKNGLSVPSFALAHLFRVAGLSGDMASLFAQAYPEEGSRLPLPSEVVATLMEECVKRDDLEMAIRVEELALSVKTPLLFQGYDPLLRLCITHCDTRASGIFARMQKDDVRLTDGFCVGLLARCADTKFLRFAEEIVQYVRSHSRMSLILYSALMKVYAFCGLFSKACDLYTQMREEGLEPDSVMYGCLMKFSVECGRTDLSQQLFEKAPSLDIQNYMSMMRAAGRDRDVDRAFRILDKLKAAGIQADKAAYNCVLDACVSAGEMVRARELLDQMKQVCSIDVIAYNTLLKGYRATGDLQGAKALFTEIGECGLEPNDVSYNCLINVAVSKGAFKETWEIIDNMERSGFPVDRYTISIILKSLKKFNNPRDISHALSLLDRTGIDVYSDEVLLNSVLETCTRSQLLHRMTSIIDDLSTKKFSPSVHTYATLIKACSTLKRLDRCWEFWKDMTEMRDLDPNDIVLGCMLDALVCNQCVEDAMELFGKWKAKVRPNTVIYSILFKGFASSRMPAEALKLWEEMRSSGLPLNTATYNAIIDSQARAGELDKVAQLFDGMEKDGCTPDAITHSTRVKAYCVQGQIDDALNVLRCMQANSMARDCVVYNTLLDGCAQLRRMDVAGAVLKDMVTYNIRPSNHTLGILVKMYGRCHRVDRAFEVVEEYANKYGIFANDKVQIALIQACISGNSPDRAMQIYAGFQPRSDAKLLHMVINGLVRQGRVKQAAQSLEEACRLVGSGSINRQDKMDMMGFLRGDTVERLLGALSQQGDTTGLIAPLLEQLRALGVPISSKSLHYAVETQECEPQDSGNKSRQKRPWNVQKKA